MPEQQAASNAMGHDMRQNLLPCDGELYLFEHIMPANHAEEMFKRLLAELDWRSAVATVMGKRHPIPRLQAWYGEGAYRYSGIDLLARPMSGVLEDLRAVAERLGAPARFNAVLANLYRDGRDSVGWHSDLKPRSGLEPVIASFSLGATRTFQLRHRTEKSLSFSIPLRSGSLLIMAGAMQAHWLHQVPKTAKAVGPRINLTYRHI